MNECKKQCSCCAFYSAYYVCGHNDFFEQNIGLCKINRKTVAEQDCCEKWRLFNQTTEARVQRALLTIPAIHRKLEAIQRTLQAEVEIKRLSSKND